MRRGVWGIWGMYASADCWSCWRNYNDVCAPKAACSNKKDSRLTRATIIHWCCYLLLFTCYLLPQRSPQSPPSPHLLLAELSSPVSAMWKSLMPSHQLASWKLSTNKSISDRQIYSQRGSLSVGIWLDLWQRELSVSGRNLTRGFAIGDMCIECIWLSSIAQLGAFPLF